MSGHSFDASSFIWLGRRYYPLYPRDVFPSVWRALEARVRSGALFVCREAFDEAAGGAQADELARWLRDMAAASAGFVRERDAVAARRGREIAARFPGLAADAGNEADAHIIAHALAAGAAVVTQEIPTRERPGREAPDAALRKIPDVCRRLGVDCVDLSKFMRREKMRF